MPGHLGDLSKDDMSKLCQTLANQAAKVFLALPILRPAKVESEGVEKRSIVLWFTRKNGVESMHAEPADA